MRGACFWETEFAEKNMTANAENMATALNTMRLFRTQRVLDVQIVGCGLGSALFCIGVFL